MRRIILSCSIIFGCGPATSSADLDARIGNNRPDASVSTADVLVPQSADAAGSLGCHDYRNNPISADQGASYDDDGDCYCETAPCTGSVNPACSALLGGDCDDCDPTVSPGSIEVNGDKVDNNCDGLADDGGSTTAGACSTSGTCPGAATCDSATMLCTDGPDPACAGVATNGACEAGCDTAALAGSTTATDYAKSLGLCNGEVVTAQFAGPSDPGAHAIVTHYGSDTTDKLNVPSRGATMVLLSTGAADTNAHDPGTDFSNTFTNPDKTVTQACGVDPNAIDLSTLGPIVCNTAADCVDVLSGQPLGDVCSSHECRPTPPDMVNDYTELKLTLKVPGNARSFSYRFQYLSSEYPSFRCSPYNDTFLAELTSKAFNSGQEANISFDANNHVVSVDNGFFQVCDVDDGTSANPNLNDPMAPANRCVAMPSANTVMAATGFDPMGQPGGRSQGAGATMELTTQNVPVQPGETITLRFIIFDEGDGILDSSVLLDNFQWSTIPSTGPVTNPPIIP
jgi:hypothetical protein